MDWRTGENWTEGGEWVCGIEEYSPLSASPHPVLKSHNETHFSAQFTGDIGRKLMPF